MNFSKLILNVLDKWEGLGPTTAELTEAVEAQMTPHQLLYGWCGAVQIWNLEETEEIFLSNDRWYSYPNWIR